MTDSPSRPFHWPGGIPAEVKPHPTANFTDEEVNEEAKDWLLFVTENWTTREAANAPANDNNYEVRHRRKLVETWAKANQGFRDSYQQRPPLVHYEAYPPAALHKTSESIPLDSQFLCLAPLSESNRANRSKWIKLYILSCRLDGEIGHCLDSYGAEHTGIEANPATFPDQSTFRYTDVLPFLFLEMANFQGIVMTSKGTVLYTGGSESYYLVDQNDLDTGRIAAVMFTWNGSLEGAVRKRAYNIRGVHLDLTGLGRTPGEMNRGGRGRTDVEGSDPWNRPLDMTLPVIDILEGAKARGEFIDFFDGARDVWEEDIETYAPGYLQMEADGNEADYHHSRLIDPDEY